MSEVTRLHAKRNRIIALSGWKGSGKDTVADYLEKHYGYYKVSFATALKDMVAHLYGIPREHFDDRTLKDQPIETMPVIPSDPFSSRIHGMLSVELNSGYWTPRALCILEGSMKRAASPGYWISRAVDSFRRMPEGKYVISDMRYKSEADTLKMLLPREELFLLRLDRFKDIDTQDPSERDLDDYRFHATLKNTGSSLEDLHFAVDFMMNHLGAAKKELK